ncbi:MAG TPA: dihydrolipoamide acetyltransferase family protein [Steroidobacteraceae bacterium]|jgi:2-oxoglutarate dehydrogenase E2 component (dihydrolipoamide succinyltransferase)
MSDALEIRAPAEQTEGTRSQILRWLKRVGEHVSENEPLIEIETDKVTVEVAAPGSGVLREILRQEQEEITPGELLGWLDASGDDANAAPVRSAPTTESGAHGAVPARPAHAADEGMRGAAAGAGQLSPAVRRLLTEHGLEPAAVQGTGQGGRLTVEDVLRAAAGKGPAGGRRAASGQPAANLEPAASGQPAPGGEQAAQSAPTSEEGVRRVPHSAMRRRTAEHMVQSLLHTAPHVTTVFEADMAAVLEDRARRREEFARRGVPLTLSAYFVQAAVAAIRVVPEANSRWTDAALEIFDAIHIGVATAVEGSGLIVPVLRDAHRRDLFDTARALDDLVSRARAGKLTPADVRGGTFTISNHGVSGSLLATPIVINQPQSAILGVGKLERRAAVIEEGDGERIAVRPRCYVTLTLDHRAMDGHQANRFMQTFVETLGGWRA